MVDVGEHGKVEADLRREFFGQAGKVVRRLDIENIVDAESLHLVHASLGYAVVDMECLVEVEVSGERFLDFGKSGFVRVEQPFGFFEGSESASAALIGRNGEGNVDIYRKRQFGAVMHGRVVAHAPGREHQSERRAVEAWLNHDTRQVFEEKVQRLGGVHPRCRVVAPRRRVKDYRMRAGAAVMTGEETFDSLVHRVPYLVGKRTSVFYLRVDMCRSHKDIERLGPSAPCLNFFVGLAECERVGLL